VQSLAQGDPQEVIGVPMIYSHKSSRLRDILIPFKNEQAKVTRTFIVRKMTRT
jgi:hypothetical protein